MKRKQGDIQDFFNNMKKQSLLQNRDSAEQTAECTDKLRALTATVKVRLSLNALLL